jgi:hypothetical protein
MKELMGLEGRNVTCRNERGVAAEIQLNRGLNEWMVEARRR